MFGVIISVREGKCLRDIVWKLACVGQRVKEVMCGMDVL